VELLYFILASYGITTIVVYGRVFAPIRPTHHFFHCPLCVGFWIGALLVCLNPFTDLFTYNVSVVNCFLMGAVSSGASYILSMLIGDEGLRYEQASNDSALDVTKSPTLLQG
jgi:hypothetical protein